MFTGIFFIKTAFDTTRFSVFGTMLVIIKMYNHKTNSYEKIIPFIISFIPKWNYC